MNQLQNIPFDIFILLVRLAFVFLLYFCLFQVVRVLIRDLRQVRPAPVAPNPYGQVVVVEPGSSPVLTPGMTFNLEPVTTIGRKMSNTIPLDDNFVSGEHARLFLRENGWWVEDWNSTNGTQLNGAEVTRPTPVLDGDILGVGGVRLKLQGAPRSA
jgi:pSer/pThr/pTyr-binding forkhead associated (FHA) protein